MLNQKEMVKSITDLTDDISAATISYWRKDELRTKLKGMVKINGQLNGYLPLIIVI